ncbi:hypothetical protein BY996DRAFT_7185221 [Phakopsora pachyrhizi]|nr:hypothetical protein BY996DRAFT_7185221 [Phakopsora pachyrhizi]
MILNSDVAVIEMPCKGVAVMRRRHDNWINATQILKVAGFDKPQRTRVLEREVQKGTHEKIQGGYGKYQGTWVPLDIGISISKRFGVDHLLAPLLKFEQSADNSPPQAPKHLSSLSGKAKIAKAASDAAIHAQALQFASGITSCSNTGRKTNNSIANFDPGTAIVLAKKPATKPNGSRATASKSRKLKNVASIEVTKPSNSHPNDLIVPASNRSQLSRQPENSLEERDLSLSPYPSDIGSSSITPSPVEDLLVPYPSRDKGKAREVSGYGDDDLEALNGRKRKYEETPNVEDYNNPTNDQQLSYIQPESPTSAKYAGLILDYFVSKSSQIPEFLINPPEDFDPNVMIDDDGHTALHWACAMGRIKIVKLLLTCGADIFRANNAGQTALMRAVMFTNNYDLRKFPQLFESFHRSTINIDKNDRTVFHYAIDIALQKGKLRAARYYLETILNRLSEYPKELADILNFQDEDGETALTLAAKCRSKRLIKILLDHGADLKIVNREGKSAEDYIMEDENFRALSPVSFTPQPIDFNQSYYNTHPSNQNATAGNARQPTSSVTLPGTVTIDLGYSETSRKLTKEALPQLRDLIESLASSFDSEAREKEHDLNQANSLLRSIQAELLDGQKKILNCESMLSDFNEKKEVLAGLELDLNEKLRKRYRFGWEKYVRDEEEREKDYRQKLRSLEAEKLFKEHQQLTLKNQSLNSCTDRSSEQIVLTEVSEKIKRLEEENSDLGVLLRIPTDIGEECNQLRSKISLLCTERSKLFTEFISLASDNSVTEQEGGSEEADVGIDPKHRTMSGNRLNNYRRLISLGCGGIGLDEVDEVIESLNEGIEVSTVSGVDGNDDSTPLSNETAPTQTTS